MHMIYIPHIWTAFGRCIAISRPHTPLSLAGRMTHIQYSDSPLERFYLASQNGELVMDRDLYDPSRVQSLVINSRIHLQRAVRHSLRKASSERKATMQFL